MLELTQLINAMTFSEIKYLKSFYKVNGIDGEERKKLFLFNLIKDEEVKSDTQAAKKIYNRLPNSAFSHLKRRLRKDILGIILLQDSEKYKLAPYRKAETDCRRLIIEGDLLLQRGVYRSAISILERAIKLAEEFELPAEQIIIKDLLRTHLGFTKGFVAYEKYTQSIHQHLSLLNSILLAKEYFNNILLPNIFKKNQEENFIDFTENALTKLEESYKNTQSSNIAYFYYQVALFYYEMKHDHSKALEFAEKFLHVVENERPIYSTTRVAGANMQIASLSLMLGQYLKAIQHAEKAVHGFKKGLLNELQALEVMFFASIRSKHIHVAQQVIDRSMLHPRLNASDFIRDKWFYYRANLEFIKGNYNDSNKYLNKCQKLLQDKSGWLFGYKILEILVLIDSGDEELIDFRVESLRKLIQRQKSKNKNITRVKSISRILSSFVKFTYNFKKTLKKHNVDLEELKIGSGNFHYDPMGFEIIRFDEWFENKI